MKKIACLLILSLIFLQPFALASEVPESEGAGFTMQSVAHLVSVVGYAVEGVGVTLDKVGVGVSKFGTVTKQFGTLFVWKPTVTEAVAAESVA